ncbi:DNA-directed RNA polymerase subunit beta' [Ceratobasidium sp. AG-Ba]|nr:DNA-directed RNA polymerase subunit beta' [Ceratobasidium sp. AG-Ba]
MPLPPIRSIWLTELKVAGLKTFRDSEPTTTDPLQTARGPVPQAQSQSQLQSQASNEPGIGSTAARPKPYDRLTADKPGEELAPDAGIWQLYVEEATEYDNELVREKNGNLDVMLLFAALFSAILTAFLIESKNLLQEDTGDVTVSLLLAIAQSQQRIEQGNPQMLSPIERPAFSIPASARWINGLWFTALALSLAAALIAMLAKEWLIAYTASRSRSARTYAHLHQKRLNGMIRWQALHIIDLLPSMLHVSLLLFSLGLAAYLWALDSGIAIAEIVITAIVLSFYGITTLLGSVYESCPYVTQISKYMRAIFHLFKAAKAQEGQSQIEAGIQNTIKVSYEDLRALLWLTEHASDPAISDCACQALAGLPVDGDLAFSQPLMSENRKGGFRKFLVHAWRSVRKLLFRKPTLVPLELPLRVQKCYRTMNSLFEHTCSRLSEANSRQHRDLKACQGINIARYSGALPAFVRHIEALTKYLPATGTKGNRLIENARPGYASNAFLAMDTAWSNECPEFSLDAYALLAAAELRLTEVATRHIEVFAGSDGTQSNKNSQSPQRTSVVDVYDNDISLHDLRARYSRAMARASIVLFLHNDGRAQISRYHLTDLLKSVTTSSRCEALNPSSILGVAWPQSEETNELPEFRINIVSTGTHRGMSPLHVGDVDGILSNIVKVLSNLAIESVPEVETAATQALGITGPTIVRQWLNAIRKYKVAISNESVLEQVLEIWPIVSNERNLPDLEHDTLAQLFCIAIVTLSQADCEYISDLTEVSIAALFSRATLESGRSTLCFLGDNEPQLIQLFIQMADWSSSRISQEARARCLQLLLIERFDGSLLDRQCITPVTILNVLNLLAHTPGLPLETRSMFTKLKPLLPIYYDGQISYVSGFIRQVTGFTVLLEAALVPEYSAAVGDLIVDIIEVATNNACQYPNDEDEQLALDAAPMLLAAIQKVAQSFRVGPGGVGRLESCIRNGITLLNRFNPQELDLATIHSGMGSIDVELQKISGDYPVLHGAHMEWQKIQNRVPTEGWCLEGVSDLFVDPPGWLASETATCVDVK